MARLARRRPGRRGRPAQRPDGLDRGRARLPPGPRHGRARRRRARRARDQPLTLAEYLGSYPERAEQIAQVTRSSTRRSPPTA
ncbi:hypothetical protein NKG05_18095 [Oerskovia sp. M15]